MSLWSWIFFLPTWLNVVLVLLAALYIYGSLPFWRSPLKFPGPKPLPLVGNLIDLFIKGTHVFDRKTIQTYGDLVLTWAAGTPQVICADPDMIRDIMIKHFPQFINRAVIRNRFSLTKVESKQITVLEDEHWKFVRSTISPAFSSGRLREMVPILHVCLQNLQDVMDEKAKQEKSIDIKPILEAYTLDAISTTSFGMESCVLKDQEDSFVKLLRSFLRRRVSLLIMLVLMFPFVGKILQKFNISSMPKESQKTISAISSLVENNMKERRQQNVTRRDLLQILMDSKVDDEAEADVVPDSSVLDNKVKQQRKHLTDDEVTAQSFVFLVAGYATTANTLSFMAYALAVNPEIQDKLIEEIDTEMKGEMPDYDNVMRLPYLDMCLSETLRQYPAATRTTREAGEDVVVKGHHIPKGLSMSIPIYYLHHHPKYWPEPEKFKPERFSQEEKSKRNPYVYLPFGLGPRNCVGMRLAQLEAKMAMVAILQKFRFVRSLETEAPPPEIGKTGLTEPVNGVWIKIEKRE